MDHKLALSSYCKGLGEARAESVGKNSPSRPLDGSEVETNQAAWTNIAVLHEHLGNPADALSAYKQALSEDEVGKKRVDDSVDSDALLRITDPANELFWEWKELGVTASVVKGSRTVQTSASIGGALRKGTQIRVGEHYVTTAQGPEKQGVFDVADVAPDGMDGVTLDGPLYKKVHKTRVTKENVSVVFNMALLHEKQGHHEASQELHKAVLAEHPTYVHSECMAQRRTLFSRRYAELVQGFSSFLLKDAWLRFTLKAVCCTHVASRCSWHPQGVMFVQIHA